MSQCYPVAVAFFTLGIGLVYVWPITMIWAAAMASIQHTKHQVWLARIQRSVKDGGHGVWLLHDHDHYKPAS